MSAFLFENSCHSDDVIQVESAEYAESIEIPEKKLTIKGYGERDPSFVSIYAKQGINSVALSIERLSFTSKTTLVKFDSVDIFHFNIDRCTFKLEQAATMTPFMIIRATNAEKASISIKESVFLQESPSQMSVISSTPELINLVLNNNRFTIDQIELEAQNITSESNHFNSKQVVVKSDRSIWLKNKINQSEFKINDYLKFNMTENNFANTKIVVNSGCGSQECKNHLECNRNLISDSDIIFESEKDTHSLLRNITLRNNVLLQAAKRDVSQVFINDLKDFVVDARYNFFASGLGPRICSNPGGRGISVTYNIDYSFWCLTRDCDMFVDYPQMLNETISMPCNTYTKGTIASIVIFSLIFVAIGGAGFIIMKKFITAPSDVSAVDFYRHELKYTSLFVAIYGLLSVWTPIAAKGVNNGCQTRVPATSCLFTQSDSHISSMLIMLWFFIVFANIALTVLSHSVQLRYRAIHYLFSFTKVISLVASFFFAIELLAFIIDYLSTRIMVVVIISLLVTFVGELLILMYLFKLKSEIQPVTLLLDKSEDVSGQSLLNSNPEEQTDLVADGQFVFYMSDYKKMAFKNFVAEGVVLGVLFPFLIWFTVFHKVIGILSFMNYAALALKAGYKIYVIRSNRLAESFPSYINIAEIFLAVTTGSLFVAYGSILFMNKNGNPSVYFVFILTAVWAFTFALAYDKIFTIRDKIFSSAVGQYASMRYGTDGIDVIPSYDQYQTGPQNVAPQVAPVYEDVEIVVDTVQQETYSKDIPSNESSSNSQV